MPSLVWTIKPQDIAEREGRILFPPYDDPHIIAGQGTVGLEIAEQLKLLGVEAHAVLRPCGGGGLVAGTATAIKERIPGCSIYSVEPSGFEDTQRSLVAGERLSDISALTLPNLACTANAEESQFFARSPTT